MYAYVYNIMYIRFIVLRIQFKANIHQPHLKKETERREAENWIGKKY